MDHGNLPPTFEGRVLTLDSTCYEQPEQPRRRAVPPVIGEIIAKLGLRYRPLSGGADLEAHAEALILLAEDCADMPPPLLDAAARRWAREAKWMPKASELREMARVINSERRTAAAHPDSRLQGHCDLLNNYGWVRASGDPYVVVGRPGEQRIVRASERARMAA